MVRTLVAILVVFLGSASVSRSEVVVFVDGTRMEVKSYEVKGSMVVLTTMEGKLRSVPANYVNLEATARANRRPAAPAAPPARAPEKPAPAQAPPAAPAPPPSPAPAPPAPAPPAPADIPRAPARPPSGLGTVWRNAELKVSISLPSAAWTVREASPSFDVAVQLDKPETEARATLALVRRPLKNYDAFRKALDEIQSSAASSPGFRPILSKAVTVSSYWAHDLRFLKDSEGRTSYNRLVSFYSKDMVYVLSLTCPEERLADNDADFEALVSRLVIERPREEIIPRGAPRS
jgi:hypothetical protein